MENNEKKVKVKTKNIPQSALKLRLVADLVRGMKADEALEVLKFTNKKGAKIVNKALVSAIASAEELHDAEAENLVISSISVDEAPTYRKYRFASRGRVSEILKRRSHLNLELTVVK